MAQTLPGGGHIDAEPAATGSEGHTDMPAAAQRLILEDQPADWAASGADCGERRSLQADAPCAVAALAETTADAWRLQRRLLHNSPDADHELIQRLNEREDGVTTDELLDACEARRDASRDLAAQLRATSLKGAIFQLYILAERLTDLDEVAPRTELPVRLSRSLDAWRAEAQRMLYSATSHLEAAALDRDLRLLRQRMLPPEYDATGELEVLARAERAQS